jgi:DNA repair protein RadA/Sms
MKKKYYICQECGYRNISWIGKCPECATWNSMIEEIEGNVPHEQNLKSPVIKADSIIVKENSCLITDSKMLNNFFGSGIVNGSSILVSGEPGIGKSTFLLTIIKVIHPSIKTLYFSGEESADQLKKRIDRLKLSGNELYLSNETEINRIIAQIEKNKPQIVFIDSIQTIYNEDLDSPPGSISQIKYCTEKINRYAKHHNITLFLVGHITKNGEIAGPKVTEHLVDVVVYFESDYKNVRFLRMTKNRFGSIDDILLFEIKEQGIDIIENTSVFFMNNQETAPVPGKCKTICFEGKRPFIIEVEALVMPGSYQIPKRYSEGVDVARINRISAILTKYLNENFDNYDIYFNIPGGIRTKDTGIDLAIASAIYSSKIKKSISSNAGFIGELSLTGSINSVYKLEQRVREMEKYNINQLYIPGNSGINNYRGLMTIEEIKTIFS